MGFEDESGPARLYPGTMRKSHGAYHGDLKIMILMEYHSGIS